jgi:hypothetical protein
MKTFIAVDRHKCLLTFFVHNPIQFSNVPVIVRNRFGSSQFVFDPQIRQQTNHSTMVATPTSLVVSNMANTRNSERSADFLTKFSLAVPGVITSLSKINADSRYEPGRYDVVCGRGKGCYNRPSNKNFRALVATYASDYVNAKTRLDKSAILCCIIDRVNSLGSRLWETGTICQIQQAKWMGSNWKGFRP